VKFETGLSLRLGYRGLRRNHQCLRTVTRRVYWQEQKNTVIFKGHTRGCTHPLLVPRLRKSRSYTSSHRNAPLWSITGPLFTRGLTNQGSRKAVIGEDHNEKLYWPEHSSASCNELEHPTYSVHWSIVGLLALFILMTSQHPTARCKSPCGRNDEFLDRNEFSGKLLRIPAAFSGDSCC
jgi:hypothetical protein